MSIVVDPSTGQVRGILRDMPQEDRAALARQAATDSLDVLFSRGIPDPAAWGRWRLDAPAILPVRHLPAVAGKLEQGDDHDLDALMVSLTEVALEILLNRARLEPARRLGVMRQTGVPLDRLGAARPGTWMMRDGRGQARKRAVRQFVVSWKDAQTVLRCYQRADDGQLRHALTNRRRVRS